MFGYTFCVLFLKEKNFLYQNKTSYSKSVNLLYISKITFTNFKIWSSKNHVRKGIMREIIESIKEKKF